MKILTNDKFIKDDPVRPDLSYAWRKSVGEIYYTGEEDDPSAIVCVAVTEYIPKDIDDIVIDIKDCMYLGVEAELRLPKKGFCLIPYTVWSYKPKAGREIIQDLREYAIYEGCKRLVTLSPQTDMAHNFHIKNGAILIRENKTSKNYEYAL